MIKVESDQELRMKEFPSCNGIAYDGKWFYFTVRGEKKIIKYDLRLQEEQCFETSRIYTSLCYDSRDNCFWAIDSNHSSILYRLNELFEPIDTIHLLIPKEKELQTTGISYDCYSNQLFIINSRLIASLEKESYKEHIISNHRFQRRIKGVVGISQQYIFTYQSKPQNEIHIYSNSGTFIGKVILPYDIRCISIEFVPSTDEENEINIYLLVAARNGEQSILCYTVRMECRCNCNSKSNCKSNSKSNSNCNSKCECSDWCSKVLECVAIEERKLAHILEVEGERFAEVKRSSNDIHEIKAAYRSVRKVINKVADKEFKLNCKLLKLKECCDFCDD